MRRFKRRLDDATFDLNLAPMLDIIVSIIPMLLMTVVFVRVMIIETPVPQVVQKTIEANADKKEVLISVYVSKEKGFEVKVNNKGESSVVNVGLKGNQLDPDELHIRISDIKRKFPDVFRLELHPEENVSLEEIVRVMDAVRDRKGSEPKFIFTDVTSGKPVETDLMFPDIVFGNVVGG